MGIPEPCWMAQTPGYSSASCFSRVMMQMLQAQTQAIWQGAGLVLCYCEQRRIRWANVSCR